MTWEKDVNNVVGSYFCAFSIEEGAAELVFVGEANLECHHHYLSTFERSIKIAVNGTPEDKVKLIAILRHSNLAVGTAEGAQSPLSEIKMEYLKQYQTALAGE